jgi:methionyl-tRNA formyltransferase
MTEPLRIVTFNILPGAYELTAAWAARNGHDLVLLVTSPAGNEARYGTSYLRLLESIPPTQDVLVTTRIRRTATPVIAALAPDLILAGTFPHRLPAALTAIPRYGALNLHPAPLPRGRGPNPQRLIYEGDPSTTMSLHRIAPEFDAGPIMSQQQRELPEQLTPETLMATWAELLLAVLEEGVARAVAGFPGEAQDESMATYAAPFTDAEFWLNWNEPSSLLQRRMAALNLSAPAARAHIDGKETRILSLRVLPDPAPHATPGTLIARVGPHAIIRTADGLVEVEVG